MIPEITQDPLVVGDMRVNCGAKATQYCMVAMHPNIRYLHLCDAHTVEAQRHGFPTQAIEAFAKDYDLKCRFAGWVINVRNEEGK